MDKPYITVTLEVSGTDEETLLRLHKDCQYVLREWRHALSYGEVNLTYQDPAQIERDAQVEADADEDAWYEG